MLFRSPNAKINLGLRITSKRPDGYHNLDTVFYPIELRDVLEVIKVQKNNDASIVVTGKEIQGPAEKNLCLKAYQLIKEDHPDITGIQIHLHKSIPMGAGMGGGSADGAHMIKLLNAVFNLGLNEEKMSKYALKLGSDCPIFIKNKPCYATGRGELLEEMNIDLSGFYLLIVSPGIHVSTAEAFEKIIPNTSIKTCKEIIQLPIEKWKDHLINDFETTVFESHPVLKSIKEKLYNMGAMYASMTGTGSTLFGIFKEKPAFENVFDEKFEVNLIHAKNQHR